MKSDKRALFFTLLFTMVCMVLQAQSLQVEGTVISKSDGEPIIGATVLEKGTTNGTITDFDGKFSLSVKQGAEITISYVGFKSQTLKAKGVLKVILEEDSEMLQEVVVTGYTTQRKADLTGSVAVVSTESLKTTSDTDPMRALQGKVAGMTITGNGSPSGTATVRIRGIGSFNSSQDPLYVIDGVPTNMSLNSLNTNDIESMQVLKDAASASIYGSRASNGVIIITTKKGKKADKVKVDFSANLTAQFYTSQSLMDVCNSSEYATAMAQAALNDGLDPVSYASNYGLNLNAASGTPITVWNPSTSQYVNYTVNGLYDGYINSKKTMRYSDTDWLDEISRVGFSQNYDLSLSHANDKHSTMFSLGYKKNNGILKYTDFENISARMNSSYNVNKYITVGENFTVTYTSQVDCAPMENALKMAPIVPVYEEDGTTFSGPVGGMSDRQNPLREQYQNKDNALNYWRLFGNGYVDIKPFKGFVFRSNFGLDFYNSFINAMTHTYHSDIVNNDIAKTTLSNKNEVNWTWSNTINYNFNVASKHDINVLLGAELSKQSSIDFSAYSEGYALEDVDYMWPNAATGVMKNTGAKVGYRLASFFGKVDYNYDDFILASFTIRQDGSSRFGKGNRWGTFPAATLGVRLSKFLKANWLDDWKVRLSWGQTGNRDIGRYAAFSRLTITNVILNGVNYKGVYPSSLANRDLKWETTTGFNLGVDFGLFNNRLSGSVELYKNKTNDLLMDRAMPEISGYGKIASNLGELANQGAELTLSSVNVNTRNVRWGTTFTYSTNKNEIKHLYGDMIDVLDAEGNIVGQREDDDVQNGWYIGHAIDEIYDYKWIGVWQLGEELEAAKYGKQPGDPRLLDVNNDGKINDEDKIWLGTKTPKHRMTLSSDLNLFKCINFSFVLRGEFGWMDIDNLPRNETNRFYNTSNSVWTEYWTPWNPNSKYARLGANVDSPGVNIYEKRNYVRMQNMALSYTFPKKLINKFMIDNLRFSINVDNAFVISKWRTSDPLTKAVTPRIWTFGVDITL